MACFKLNLDVDSFANPGVYAITTHLGVYIGQGQSPLMRFAWHHRALLRGNHECKRLQEAWNEQPHTFRWSIVTNCSVAELAQVEEKTIIELKSRGTLLINCDNKTKHISYRIKKEFGRYVVYLLDKLTNKTQSTDFPSKTEAKTYALDVVRKNRF